MTERERYRRRLIHNLGFVLLFGKVSDAELIKIVLWIKDELETGG
jgi:hypothetical protein